MLNEEWRPITVEKVRGLYEVSNLGRVRSIPRLVTMGRPGRTFSQVRGGKVLKSVVLLSGYSIVTLSGNGMNRAFGVHRLICAAFHGPRPSAAHQCNHKNGKRSDNRADNLEWMTPKENTQHSINVLRGGIHNCRAVLTEEQVVEIRQLKKSGMTCKKIANRFGVTDVTISNACRGKTWKHINPTQQTTT